MADQIADNPRSEYVVQRRQFVFRAMSFSCVVLHLNDCLAVKISAHHSAKKGKPERLVDCTIA